MPCPPDDWDYRGGSAISKHLSYAECAAEVAKNRVPYYNKQGKQPLKKSRFEREIGTTSRKKVKKFLKAHKGAYIVATGE